MPIYPGDPGVSFEPAMVMDDGHCANVTRITMGSQTGTHFDAPHHILNNGMTSDAIPLSVCYGPVQVIEIPKTAKRVEPEHFKGIDLSSTQRLLLKTHNSQLWQHAPNTFQNDYVGVSPEAAAYLVQAAPALELIGIDYLSVECFGQAGLGAHKAFLDAGVFILEGLDLSLVDPGYYILSAFPIKYRGLDGTPTRAVLIQTEI